jgi:hypothetical protein
MQVLHPQRVQDQEPEVWKVLGGESYVASLRFLVRRFSFDAREASGPLRLEVYLHASRRLAELVVFSEADAVRER